MTINVDTDAKTFDVSLNGTKLTDISRVEIYQSWNEDDEYSVRLGTCKEDNGIRTYTEYALECECEESEMAEAGKITASKIEGFVAKSTESDIHKQIQKWLRNG